MAYSLSWVREEGSIDRKWTDYKFKMKLVNPANKRKTLRHRSGHRLAAPARLHPWGSLVTK